MLKIHVFFFVLYNEISDKRLVCSKKNTSLLLYQVFNNNCIIFSTVCEAVHMRKKFIDA